MKMTMVESRTIDFARSSARVVPPWRTSEDRSRNPAGNILAQITEHGIDRGQPLN
jgi:hypothetical protein